MRRTFRHLFNISIEEPLPRQQARILQLVFCGLVLAAGSGMIVAFFDNRPPPLPLASFLVSLALVVISLLGLYLLQHQHLKLAALVSVAAIEVIVLVFIALNGIGTGNRLIFFSAPLLLAGFILSRRELLLIWLSSVLGLAVALALMPKSLPDDLSTTETLRLLANFVLITLVLLLLVERFNTAFRASIGALHQRQADLAVANNALQAEIQRRQQAEAERLELSRQQERLRAFREFIDNITHDLKSPLSVIGISLYMLEALNGTGSQQREIENIKKQVATVQSLIQDILNASRLDHPYQLVLQPVDLKPVLRSLVDELDASSQTRGLQLDFHTELEDAVIAGDESELHRVFANLLENAIKYTPAGGAITVNLLDEAQGVAVEVVDTGLGIPPEEADQVFERFFRASTAKGQQIAGTGLGLAIAQKIIDLHGGRISLHSQPGQGSTFRVWLPAEAPELVSAEA
jgi:signal transduction histidine kinase